MNKRPKVIHLSASDSGGAFVFAENLIRELQNTGVEADHAIFTGARANIGITGNRIIDRAYAVGLHAGEKFMQLFHEKDASVRFKFSLGRPGIPASVLRKITAGYDLVHLHWINKGFIELSTMKELKQPLVWTCHDLWPVSGGCHLSNGCMRYETGCGMCPYLKHPSDNDLSSRIYNRKKEIYGGLNLTLVAPSQWMGGNLEKSGLGKNLKRHVVHNGVNTEIFKPVQTNHNPQKFTVGFVAANLNDGNKALYRLAEAMGKLDNPEAYRLMLIGEQKAAFDFALPEHTNIVSGVSDPEKMAGLYAETDMLACTSTLETFPTTLMEAYCCGTSCTGFDTGGVPEILGAMGEQALACYDTDALAARIAEARANQADRTAVAQKANGLFGIAQTARSYKKIYQDLLDNELH